MCSESFYHYDACQHLRHEDYILCEAAKERPQREVCVPKSGQLPKVLLKWYRDTPGLCLECEDKKLYGVHNEVTAKRGWGVVVSGILL